MTSVLCVLEAKHFAFDDGIQDLQELLDRPQKILDQDDMQRGS